MMRSIGLCLLVGCLLVEAAPTRVARAANTEEARVYLDKATAAYALNHYAVAAENFEKAFELKPDPALLYNAAQSYRLGGNKERALELYESYLRVYGKKDPSKREQIEARIKELKQAIDHDKAVATSPPVTTEPVGGTPTSPAAPPAETAPVKPLAVATATPGAPPPAAPPPAEAPAGPVTLTATPSPSTASDEPVTHKTWFWVAIGAVVVAGGVTALLLATGGSDPATASIGRASGN